MLLTSFNWKKEVLSSQEPVLVDFWAPWCGPCRAMAPILDAISRDHKVCKVDVDKNQALATHYQIDAIPCLMIFHHGQPVSRHDGATSESVLRSELNRCLKAD